jgi:hypothetical protein
MSVNTMHLQMVGAGTYIYHKFIGKKVIATQ